MRAGIAITFRAGCLLFCAAGLLLVHGHAAAQEQRGVIEGYLYNRETKKVISGANIYISETTLGDASDEEGYFRIANIPPGEYRLVISHIGYEIYSRRIQIGENRERFVEQALTPAEHELGTAVVTSAPRRAWERNLKHFEKYFIGETENGRQTEILNPGILNFETDMSMLHAEAEEDLRILNHSLGYEITLNLTYFEWNYITDTGSVLYFCRFRELDPANDTESQKWQTNRRKTYKYSPERFFKSLVNGTDKSEYEITGGKIYQKSRREQEGYRLFKKSNEIYRFKISLVYPNNHSTVTIDDPNIADDEKQGYIGYNESKDEVTDEIYVDRNGNIQNPLDFMLGGVWYEYRLADKLPMNYVYEKK